MPPRKCLAMSGDVFFVVVTLGGDATGILRVEAKDAAKCPTVHRTAPTTNN